VRVLVCGGRDYTNHERAMIVLDEVHARQPITLIIEGGARGADRLGRDWAKLHNIPVHTEEAQWAKFGRSAGALRNIEMLKQSPDLVVAFKGGKGTAHMTLIARAAGIPLYDAQ
jgi:hypothetical protein